MRYLLLTIVWTKVFSSKKCSKIIRQVVKPDGTEVDIETDTATYIKQMKLGQAGAKLRHYKNTYTNISALTVKSLIG